jgi:hypothetical protein
MPEVQAVEIADGDRVGRAEGSETVGDAHGADAYGGGTPKRAYSSRFSNRPMKGSTGPRRGFPGWTARNSALRRAIPSQAM